jgi:hypothetical protein
VLSFCPQLAQASEKIDIESILVRRLIEVPWLRRKVRNQ